MTCRLLGLTTLLVVTAALLAAGPAPAQDVSIRIVGGNNAEAGEYPWQIALEGRQSPAFAFRLRCGGTVIADDRVVTAAHCTSGMKPSNLRVRVHSQQLESGGTVIGVSSYAEHSDYRSNTLENDVSVLDLAGSATAAGGQTLQLIGQEGSSDNDYWNPGDMLAISGWGTTSSNSNTLPTQLQEAEVPRVADPTCAGWYGTLFYPTSMVCAGFAEGNVDTCSGDSGGPMAAPIVDGASATDPSKWRLVGITSWGIGCAEAEQPGVYTRVAAPGIRNFILDNTGTPSTFPLIVSVTGGGTVTSSAGGITCPGDCSQNYASGLPVQLTAHPNQGETFISWGDDCSANGSATTCALTMDAAHTASATFSSTSPVTHTLTLTKSGTGSGTVTSSPGGINCGSDCSHSYNEGQSVTLSASAAAGSAFRGWSDPGCRGTSSCTILMDGDHSLTATFTAQSPAAEQPPPDDGSSDPFTPGVNDPLETFDDTPPIAEISSTELVMSKRGYVRVGIDCSDSPEDCLSDLRIRMRFPDDLVRTIAHGEFDVTAGEHRRARLRLTRRARHRVRQKGQVHVRVILEVEDAAGNARKLRKRLVLAAAE